MPLDIPDLDDRNYDDLVEESAERIPAHTPEWTNPREGDPGVALGDVLGGLVRLGMVTIVVGGLAFMLLGPAAVVRQIVAPLPGDLLDLTSVVRQAFGQPGLVPVTAPPPTDSANPAGDSPPESESAPPSDSEAAPTAISDSPSHPTATPTPTATPVEGAPVSPPDNTTTEVVGVWYCKALGGGQYEWYEVAITYDEEGNPIKEETLGGPYTGYWQPNCPGGDGGGSSGGSDDGSDDGGGGSDGNGNDPTCTCERVCLQWGSANQCAQWGHQDCQGNTCNP